MESTDTDRVRGARSGRGGVVLSAPSGDIILSARNLTKQFVGFTAVERRRPRRRARHHPRADRPERRRQDHLLQPAHQVPAADRGQHHLQRARHHRACRPADIARLGHGALVPDLGGFPAADRRSRTCASRCSAGAATASTSGARRRRSATSTPRRSRLLEEVGLTEFAHARRRRAPLRPQAGARDRHHAGARPRDDAARRADGRHGAGGRRAHHRADPPGRRRTAPS